MRERETDRERERERAPTLSLSLPPPLSFSLSGNRNAVPAAPRELSDTEISRVLWLLASIAGGSLVTDAPMSGELRLEKGRGKESENVCGWAGVRERES